jgi:hypothetical protein
MPIVDPSQPVDYSSDMTPSNYICGQCNRSRVKLWRNYRHNLAEQSLCCARCSARAEGVDISSMQPTGSYTDEFGYIINTIGSRSPAVPTPRNDTYWGYGHIPPEAYEWWRRLPL